MKLDTTMSATASETPNTNAGTEHSDLTPGAAHPEGGHCATGADGETVITNVRALIGSEIIDNAIVVFRDGVITDARAISSSQSQRYLAQSGGTKNVIDGYGRLLTAGFIDSHSDGLEKEANPRRTAKFDLDFALKSFECRVSSCGITTLCHGVSYQDTVESNRSIANARETIAVINRRRAQMWVCVDHRLLLRTEARDPLGIQCLLEDIDAGLTGELTPIVSFEDHTPGQGQYGQPSKYAAAIDPESLPKGVTPDSYVEALMAKNEALIEHRDLNQQRLTPRAKNAQIVLLGHDLDSVEQVEFAADMGAGIAEFPVTTEAAHKAREVGMSIVMGAPNAMRGYSHNDNTSARELIGDGLCDVLASDYMPAAMLGAVAALVEERICDVVSAFSLITSGPAHMLGLSDRGVIAAGYRSDLVLIDMSTRWPVVTQTFSATAQIPATT